MCVVEMSRIVENMIKDRKISMLKIHYVVMCLIMRNQKVLFRIIMFDCKRQRR